MICVGDKAQPGPKTRFKVNFVRGFRALELMKIIKDQPNDNIHLLSCI